MLRVAIMLFDDVEVLDACGPFEVFATTKDGDGSELFEVVTVAAELAPVRAVGGLQLLPHYTLRECPHADILIVPGGVGRRREVSNAGLIAWIVERSSQAEITMSVCTGAFLLAKAGLLDGLEVTTHASTFDELAESFPTVTVKRDVRFVDQGRIVTAAGIAAGIDASLYLVARLCGREIAARTASRMEYPLASLNPA